MKKRRAADACVSGPDYCEVRLQLQEPEIGCSERACICRSTSVPVRATRWPTWCDSLSLFDASTTSTGADPFFRNPDFQLRAFGASAPSVSVSRNDLPARARHPASVTAGDFPSGDPVESATAA